MGSEISKVEEKVYSAAEGGDKGKASLLGGILVVLVGFSAIGQFGCQAALADNEVREEEETSKALETSAAVLLWFVIVVGGLSMFHHLAGAGGEQGILTLGNNLKGKGKAAIFGGLFVATVFLGCRVAAVQQPEHKEKLDYSAAVFLALALMAISNIHLNVNSLGGLINAGGGAIKDKAKYSVFLLIVLVLILQCLSVHYRSKAEEDGEDSSKLANNLQIGAQAVILLVLVQAVPAVSKWINNPVEATANVAATTQDTGAAVVENVAGGAGGDGTNLGGGARYHGRARQSYHY